MSAIAPAVYGRVPSAIEVRERYRPLSRFGRRGDAAHPRRPLREPDRASPSSRTTPRSPTARAARCASTTSTKGPPTGRVVLLLHGEPSWCFLYRHMIPVLADGRVPVRRPRPRRVRPLRQADRDSTDYTLRPPRRVDARAAVRRARPRATSRYFGQDWGSLIGLRLVGEHPDRFARVAIGNSGLPDRRRQAQRRVPRAGRSSPRSRRTFPIGRDRQRRMRDRSRPPR